MPLVLEIPPVRRDAPGQEAPIEGVLLHCPCFFWACNADGFTQAELAGGGKADSQVFFVAAKLNDFT
ncbi:MAG TPA: hypothetical protein GX745_07995 [Clostridiales bacterium]|nr:hypothetical protein [Clostridiales bacterium]